MVRTRVLAGLLIACALVLGTGRRALAAPGSLQFDKKGYVSCGDVFNVPEGTIEFWFKPSSTANNVWVFSKNTRDKTGAMELGFGTVGIMYTVKTNGEWTYAWINRDQVSTDEWHHLACVFRKDRATLFLDGTPYLKNTLSGAFGMDHLAGGELRLGRGNSEVDFYRGLIGPVRLSDRVRYTAAFAPQPGPFTPDENTVAVWNFDEETGTEVRDAAGKQAPAKIVGAVTRSRETPGGDAKTAPGAEFGILPVLRTKQPPAIDGMLEDACWKSAATADGFVAAGSDGWTPAPRQTTLKTAYDDKCLYLAAVCLEPDMAGINARETTRDGPIYEDDCLELFLDVANDRTNYCHYVFNSLGAYYDGRNMDKSWNSTIQASAKRLGDRWTLEAAIPFDQLKVAPPKEGTFWGFNVAREHRLGESLALSTWATLMDTSFHKPAAFALLSFAGEKIPGSLDYSNRKPAIRNSSFSEVTADGKPIGWKLGPKTRAQETAYLSGVHYLITDADDLMARQEVAFCNVAGRKYELTVAARGEGGACLTVALITEKTDGSPGRLTPLQDQAMSAASETFRAKVSVPADVRKIAAVELHRSNGRGMLEIREIALNDLSAFREVREAADEMPEHRRPVGEPFASDCVRWGTPLSGGPLNVLFIMDGGGNREAVELSERVEMKYDIVWQKNGSLLAYGAERVNARLARKDTPYDVIILSAPLHNETMGRALRDNVAAGTGLVCIQMENGEGLSRSLQPSMPRRVDLTQEEPGLARHAPWRRLGGMIKSMGVGDVEKGKIVSIGYESPINMRGILPRATSEYDELGQWWEYVYALVGNSVVAVSRRSMPAAIDSCAVDLPNGELTAKLASKPGFTGALRTIWTDKERVADGFETTDKVAIAAGGDATVVVKIPDAVARSRGVHVAQLFLRDADGKAVDWSSVAIQTAGTARLAGKHPFPADCYQDGDKPEGRVLVEDGQPQMELSVTAELVDAYDRVIWSETRAVQAPEMAFAPDFGRAMTVYHTFRATLRDKQGAIDRQSWPLYLRDRWNWVADDFRAGVNCDYFVRAHTDRLFARWFQGFGMKFTSEGGCYDAAPRDDMPWFFMNLDHPPMHDFSRNPIRTPCFNAPGVMEQIVGDSVVGYGAVRKYAPMFCSMADEAELSRDGTAEVCFCEHCAARFRQWARDAYGTLDKVNAEWGTVFKDWAEIGPIHADEARKRGNPAQWVDFRTFMEDVWIGGFKTVKEAVKRRYPDARLTLTDPFMLNPFSGEDHYKSAKAEDVFAKYARPDLTKEIRSFSPDTQLSTYYGYLEGLPYCKWYPWWFAFNGGDYMVWWSSLRTMEPYDLFDVTGRQTARSMATVETIQDLVHGAGKVLHEFPVVKDPVAVLYSQSSMHCSWIESDMKVGDAPWSSIGFEPLPNSNPFALNFKSRDRFKGLLKENGVQPDFLAPEQIEAGRLAGCKLLVLPCAYSVSDAVLSKIDEFVRNGGTVVADLRLGLYSEHGKPLPSRAAVESLFGFKRASSSYKTGGPAPTYQAGFAVLPPSGELDKPMGCENLSLTTGVAQARFADGTPAVIVNSAGKGKAIYLNFVPGFGVGSQSLMAALLETAGVERPVRLTAGDKPAFGYETYRFARGAAMYVGILRDMPPIAPGARASRVGPLFLNATNEKETVTARLGRVAHVYDVRAGKYLGKTDTVSLPVPPSDAKLLAMLPYEVRALSVAGARQSWRRGETAEFAMKVIPGAGDAGDHVLRIEAVGPDGRSVAHYCANALAEGGQFTMRIPLSLNERRGSWKVKATDVASGVSTETAFIIEE